MGRFSLLLLISGPLLHAQNPAVSLVVNAASNFSPALPNGGIAQGALMTIYGTALGPPTLTIVPAYPIPTNLAGTSVRITSGGKSFDAPMYYTSSSQVAAIVPSTTPPGTGTVTVTYNGKVSPAAPITLVQNNVGLYTVNSQGTGGAVVTFPDYSYLTPANAANPGETVILWANGLGPIPGDDAQLPVSVDMPSVPLEVLIGGKSAAVQFHGRNSCCASLDQINVQIPAGVAGCITPIVLKIGTQVSNTATIPIAANGRACTSNDPATSDSLYQTLIGKSQFVLGQIAMLRSTILTLASAGAINTTNQDSGSAFFFKFNAPYLSAGGNLIDLPPPGSCAMTISQSAGGTDTNVYLDAGPAVTINGPSGIKTYTKTINGAMTAYFPVELGFGFLDGGPYTASGTGGPNVGSFSVGINYPKAFAWTNQGNQMSVDRASGMKVNWTGGSPASLVQISGQTSVAASTTSTVSARFDCWVKASDGTFTIPPAVLLAMPATTPTSLGTLTVGTNDHLPFTATGVDRGLIYFGTAGLNLGTVTYR